MIHVYGFNFFTHVAAILTKPSRDLTNSSINKILLVDYRGGTNDHSLDSLTVERIEEIWKFDYKEKTDRISIPTLQEGFFQGLDEALNFNNKGENLKEFKAFYNKTYKPHHIFYKNCADAVYALLENCGSNKHVKKSFYKSVLGTSITNPNIRGLGNSVLNYARELRNKIIVKEINNPPFSGSLALKQTEYYKLLYPREKNPLLKWILNIIKLEKLRYDDGFKNISENSCIKFLRRKELYNKENQIKLLQNIHNHLMQNAINLKTHNELSIALSTAVACTRSLLIKSNVTNENMQLLVKSLRNTSI